MNNSLKRCPHKIPTVEELNPLFANAKVFSKLDAKAGYWSVRLSKESQLLTTFQTPFGRYCWQRLPFGLNVPQDIFQARMDQILEGLPGVTGITEDVCVRRHGWRARRKPPSGDGTREGEGSRVQQREVRYQTVIDIVLRQHIHSRGYQPGEDKIRDIVNMPTPQNKEQLHSFIGYMTYLSQFIQNFAEKAQTLRDLQYVPRNMHTVCAVYWPSDAVACSCWQCMGRVRVYGQQYASDIC